ncbi:PREDICTED: ribonuclease H2 subunit A-like, partial [Rhagoletis zephyria]|uniref:ribonuclease H2 subunit A-like n=1 Tax=Rhagoletis zephyria TaxID=28612 RepID=UPI000811A14D
MADLGDFFEHCNELYHLSSKVPKEARQEDCILGIDEAGRGPVLGPMVYGAAYYPVRLQDNLKGDKFQDSKTLTEKERSAMFEKMKEYNIGWFATVLSPIVISNAMLKRSKYNLNALSHDTAINLIRKAIESGVQLKEVYLDTVGPADKYQIKLRALFPNIKVVVSNKADSIYKIVSVASICAKVTRDHAVKNWQFLEEGISFSESEYGSGYPGDPKTKDFLKKAFDPLFGFPTFVRFSWSTITKIMEEKAIGCE